MTLETIFTALQRDSGAWVWIIAIMMSLVQISPIKIDPWSKLFGWIGVQFMHPFESRLKGIEDTIAATNEKLDKHIEDDKNDRIDRTRQEIITLGSRLKHGKPLTEEELKRGVEKCDWYESYIEENHIKNGVATSSIKAIKAAWEATYEQNK